jgi:hypothetical protein
VARVPFAVEALEESRMTASSTATPPRWAERLLRFFLSPRDRDTIPGDLLEEYREHVVPARGRTRANFWYVRQVLSLADGITLGAATGMVFGAWMLANTWAAPLADDTIGGLIAFYGPMFFIWATAGFLAYRRTGRLGHAAKVGAMAAFATFLVFSTAALVRVNLFLDVITARPDWHGMRDGFPVSGFDSMRSYANYVYIKDLPFKVFVAAAIGAAFGLTGALMAALAGRPRTTTVR